MKLQNAWMLLLVFGAGSASWAEPPEPAVESTVPASVPSPAPASVPLPAVAPEEAYRLRPGDVLTVAVWKETDLQGDVLVRPDGGMSFALAGELAVGGHSVADVTAMLEQRIRKYIPDAVVTVAVKSTAGNRVYVIGKVNRPGDFPLLGPIDVMQALTLAGGATPFADTSDIRILRREEGRQKALVFHYGEVERGRRLDQNILLQSGDTVVVP